MKILIVENELERIKVFKWMFSGHDITVAELAHEAISLILSNKYDYIFLDHDLDNDAGYMHHTEYQTGMTVAATLVETDNVYTPILIHSWNPYSSKVLYEYLISKRCIVIKRQFGLFDNSIVNELADAYRLRYK